MTLVNEAALREIDARIDKVLEIKRSMQSNYSLELEGNVFVAELMANDARLREINVRIERVSEAIRSFQMHKNCSPEQEANILMAELRTDTLKALAANARTQALLAEMEMVKTAQNLQKQLNLHNYQCGHNYGYYCSTSHFRAPQQNYRKNQLRNLNSNKSSGKVHKSFKNQNRLLTNSNSKIAEKLNILINSDQSLNTNANNVNKNATVNVASKNVSSNIAPSTRKNTILKDTLISATKNSAGNTSRPANTTARCDVTVHPNPPTNVSQLNSQASKHNKENLNVNATKAPNTNALKVIGFNDLGKHNQVAQPPVNNNGNIIDVTNRGNKSSKKRKNKKKSKKVKIDSKLVNNQINGKENVYIYGKEQGKSYQTDAGNKMLDHSKTSTKATDKGSSLKKPEEFLKNGLENQEIRRCTNKAGTSNAGTAESRPITNKTPISNAKKLMDALERIDQTTNSSLNNVLQNKVYTVFKKGPPEFQKLQIIESEPMEVDSDESFS